MRTFKPAERAAVTSFVPPAAGEAAWHVRMVAHSPGALTSRELSSLHPVFCNRIGGGYTHSHLPSSCHVDNFRADWCSAPPIASKPTVSWKHAK
jgi:hypothetical protein